MQGLLDISDEIVYIFNSDAQTQESVRNAQLASFFRLEMCVGRVAGLTHERIHPAQARRVAEDAQLPDEPVGRPSTTDKLQPEHPAKAAELRLGDLVVGMHR